MLSIWHLERTSYFFHFTHSTPQLNKYLTLNGLAHFNGSITFYITFNGVYYAEIRIFKINCVPHS